MTNDVILCGVGGQGTVLASRLISTAAMQRGLRVLAAETIGMAQRGGSVTSHVRLGDEATSPLIGHGCADLLIGFEPAEAVRQLAYLKPGGTAVVSNRAIVPASVSAGGPGYDLAMVMDYLRAQVSNLVVVDALSAAADLGSAKCLNVVLLGAAAQTGALGLSPQDIQNAVRTLVPERFLDLNERALQWGMKA